MTQPKPSPGDTLRNARIRKGLSVEQLADELRLTNAAVRFLEADEFGEFKARVFVIGYLKSYARVVGVDQELINRQFQDIYEEDGSLETIELVPDNSDWFYKFLHRRMSSLLVGSFVFVLLIVFGIIWYFGSDEQQVESNGEGLEANDGSNSTETTGTDDQPFYLESYGSDDGEEQLPTSLSSDDVIEPSIQPAYNHVDRSTRDNSSEIEFDRSNQIVVNDSRTASVVVGEGIDATRNIVPRDTVIKTALEFRFTADCWLEAYGEGQDEIYTNLAEADEVVILMMTPPIRVKIGNAAAAKLIYRGKPYSFLGKTFGNVVNLALDE